MRATVARLTRIPKSIFTAALGNFTEKYFKTTHTVDEAAMRRECTRLLLDGAESLIISPKTTFKVYGENVIVPVLVDFFGVAGVEQLLDEDAIDFILWRELITTMVDDLPGIHPLQSVVLDNDAHGDALASAELGMTWNKNVSLSDAKRIAAMVAARTHMPPAGVAARTVASVHAAFADGRLKDHGFDPACMDLANVPTPYRTRMANLAEDVMTAATLFEEEIDLYGEDNTWHALVTMIKRIAHQRGVFESVESVLRLERVPSLQNLMLKRVISWQDVLKLRRRSETEEFRRWLWSQDDPADKTGVTDRYLALMLPKHDRASPTWRKAARISISSLTGTVLGALVAGPVGGAVGAAAGTAVSTGVSLFDGLFADKILGRTNPRRFATDVLGPLMAAMAKSQVRPVLTK